MESRDGYDEADLIRTFRLGTPEAARTAFGEIYDANDKFLRAHLSFRQGLQTYEIDEVCSVVWERALDRLADFTPQGIPYLAWLKRTAGFVIKERLRKRMRDSKYTTPLSDEEHETLESWEQDPLLGLLEAEDEAEATQRREEIKAAVDAVFQDLPRDQQEVITARDELGLSAQQAAETLGWNVNKIYSDYNRGKKRMRESLLRRFGVEQITVWSGIRPVD